MPGPEAFLLALLVPAILALALAWTNPFGFYDDEYTKKLLVYLGAPLVFTVIVFLFVRVAMRSVATRRTRQELKDKLDEAEEYANRLYKKGGIDGALTVFKEARTAFEEEDFKRAEKMIIEVNKYSYDPSRDKPGGRKNK